MLESFISTQKLSVQKMLARKFARFMSYKRDFLELLMSTLQSLVREQLQIESITGAVGGDEVLVPLRCATGPGVGDQELVLINRGGKLQIESITGAVGGDEVLVPLRCAVGLDPQDQGSGISWTRIRRRVHGQAAADQVHLRGGGRQRGACAAAVRRTVRERE